MVSAWILEVLVVLACLWLLLVFWARTGGPR